MNRFYVGQKLRCLNNYGWCHDHFEHIELPGPNHNEEVTCIGYAKEGYVLLKEHAYDPSGFTESEFEPIEELKLPLISYSKVLEKERELVGVN